MFDNGKITSKQFTLLVTLFTIGSSILYIPSFIASEAKQDAWLSALMGVALGLLIILLFHRIGTMFPNMTIVQYSEKILGKWLGKLVSVLICTHFYLLSGLVLRNIGDYLITILLPQTPIQAVHILFLSIIIMGARLGIETIARMAEILFPLLILFYLMAMIGLMPEIELIKLQPVFEGGVKPIIRGIIPFVGSPILELVVFLMIIPFMNRLDLVKKNFLTGGFMGGIFLTVPLFFCLVVLGPDLTAANVFASFTVTKKINIGDFYQRIDVIIAYVAFICVYFKATLCFYVSLLGFGQTFHLKDFRFLTFPMGMILIVFSIVAYPNSTYAASFFKETWMPYAATFGLFLPLLLLGVAAVRKKYFQ
ncbi:endospore germination permease [Bacillus sp. 3255]|uniref:GerAB/ArcD/ProY family transporter n=1 Tax=Bacillus sp. 3255 TaxID=2817904 RepID=UPI00285CC39D|nr:endospore germination permease [Bacillus sp. 3255]MDR6882469.1 spore germination protein KB [Bacillus sp. 3255]